MSIREKLSAAPVVPLRYLVSFNPRPTSDSGGDAVYLPMEAISEFGPADTSRRRPVSELRQGYSYVADGDIALAKVTPCFENGKGLVARNLPDGQAFATTEVTVMRPSSKVEADYLGWNFQSSNFLKQGESHMTGSGGLRRVPEAFVGAYSIPLPDRRTQRAVANFLDRETDRIDTLIKEQQRLIEMLRERRDSAWAACVETARRLGRPVTVRRAIESIVDGPFGSSLTSAHYSDQGARVIRLGNIGVNEFKDGDAAFIPLDYAEELEAHAVEQGDVVVAGLGDDKMPLGRAAVVPALGLAIVKADCYRLRPNEQVGAAYLAWVMSAPQTRSQIMLLARGSTRARLNTRVVQQVEIPLPDRDTQDALVAQSEAETSKIDRLIAESERLVGFARERRAALITAAVTGQIDVREMA